MKNKFKAFLNCDPKEIKESVILSPILSPKDFDTKGKASRSLLGYLTLNAENFTFIRCPRGSNWAAELVPFLKTTNCKKIVFLGALGALSGNLKIGDLVAAESAQSIGSLENWILDNRMPDTPPQKAVPTSPALLKKINLPKGPIASVPLIVKETKEKLEKIKKAGFMGIEMESGPLYLAGQKEGLAVIGIYIVSDLPLSKPFYSKDFTFPRRDKLIEFAKTCE